MKLISTVTYAKVASTLVLSNQYVYLVIALVNHASDLATLLALVATLVLI